MRSEFEEARFFQAFFLFLRTSFCSCLNKSLQHAHTHRLEEKQCLTVYMYGKI